ncbi:MAG: hypothetical protein AAGB15_00395 [Pseudomonadota bacterium]
MLLSATLPALFLLGAAPDWTKAPEPDLPLIQIRLDSWSAHQDGNNWIISKGNVKLRMPDEKTAKKTAKKFNKMEKKDKKKKESGVYDDGSRACNEPTATTLC